MNRLARRLVLPLLATSILAGLAGPGLARSLNVEALATCDRLAPLPSLDPTRQVTRISEIEEREQAVEACRKAYEMSLRPVSLKLQYARALISTGHADAVPLLREVAQTGDLEAHFGLFWAYRTIDRKGAAPTVAGRLVSRAEAEGSLRKAAEGGHPDAIYYLGRALGGGWGLRRDTREARLWLERSMGEAGRADERLGNALTYADLIASDPDATPAERERAYVFVKASAEDGSPEALLRHARFLRAGIGVKADPAQARALLREALKARHLAGSAGAPLAEMMLAGEGGPVDVKGAVALITNRSGFVTISAEMQTLKARLLRDGNVPGLGRDRSGAIRALATVAGDRTDAIWMLAELMTQHAVSVPEMRAADIRFVLEERVDLGEVRAMVALGRLKLAGGSLRDEAGGFALLERAAAAGDEEAQALLAQRWGEWARRGTHTRSDEARALLERLMGRGHAVAYRVYGRLRRDAGLYPQDDEAATKALVRAAELGDAEAMLLAADALEAGLGIEANRPEALRWLRAAAKAGSARAVERLAGLYPFSKGEMTLREGVTELVALYNEGVALGSAPSFIGSPLGRNGPTGLARAIMDAFRIAPVGLEEERLMPLMRVTPKEVRAAMEGELAAQGFLARAGEGHFGPEARAALKAWVDARGLLGADAPQAPSPASAPGEPKGYADVTIPDAVGKRMTAHVKGLLDRGKTPADWRVAVRNLNHLARFGDPGSRWFVVKRFDDDAVLREEVSTGEVVRYTLDLVAMNPPELAQVSHAGLFNVSHVLLQRGDHKGFLDAFFDLLREDARLQGRLGAVQSMLKMAPLACGLITREAKARGVAGFAGDGCGEGAREALVAWARTQGPTGSERARRLEARAEILKAVEGLGRSAEAPQRARP